MRDRIHTLQHEIKTIEGIIDTLNGPMLDMALEELRNLQFEMDMLNRSMQKSDVEYLMASAQVSQMAEHTT